MLQPIVLSHCALKHPDNTRLRDFHNPTLHSELGGCKSEAAERAGTLVASEMLQPHAGDLPHQTSATSSRYHPDRVVHAAKES